MSEIQRKVLSGCMGCRLNRRRFLAGCVAAAAGVGAGGLASLAARAGEAEAGAKPKIRLVFTHIPSTGPSWPNIGYDFDARKKQLTEGLAQACPDIEFLPATVMNGDEAKKLLEGDKEVDGYLVYMLGIWTGAPQVIAAAGRPTLFVDDLYGGSGEFLIAYSAARRAGQKVAAASSSRFGDVTDAARCFGLLKKPGGSADAFVATCASARTKSAKAPCSMTCTADAVTTIAMDDCRKRLRESTILAVGGGWGNGKAIEEVIGTKVAPIEFKELHEAYEKADRDEARTWADRWAKAAEKIVEPTRQDLEDSGAMYVAMREVMGRHNARAITINCLGGFYGGHIKAYPCLGFCQFNDDGLVGACEGDLTSTITMLTVGTLTGRPGFISDPVIDTSKNQIIYAHCVAPTKVFGGQGKANPYHIRSHSEDRKGACLRSLLPLGHMTTTIEIDAGRKQMVLHQAKTVDNIDEDKACRTKLAAEPKGDIEKLLTFWDQWGWHRVTFYGDLKPQAQELAKAFGLTIIEEA
ncbi:MAG: hypothetical protein IMZ55_13955 [Acidobacteria bacterium]|nr:hypothetical protein [Acidobacteriota bacterium]